MSINVAYMFVFVSIKLALFLNQILHTIYHLIFTTLFISFFDILQIKTNKTTDL